MQIRPQIPPEIPPHSSLAKHFAAAQDWWREAGVDQHFVDEVQVWLDADGPTEPGPAPAARQSEHVTEQEPEHVPLLRTADLPETLAEFGPWWCGPDNPFAAPPATSVPPRGPAEARIMVIVPMPESEDRETLLSGPQGRLLANMLGALGVAPQDAFLASALPAHQTLPDWDQLRRDGLDLAIARLIALVRPQRLLLLGNALDALTGPLAELPVLGGYRPDQYLENAHQRARLWPRLLAWMPAA